MSNLATRSLLLCLLPLIAGCGAGGITYQTSHDDLVDFTKLRTFDWLVVTQEDKHNLRDPVVLELIAAELEAKGLRRQAQQPDLLVSAHRSFGGVQNTTRSGYEFRDGRLTSYQLQEGTLIVDLVDAKSRRGIWRGTATAAIRTDSFPEERRALLTEVVHKMFAQYPPAR